MNRADDPRKGAEAAKRKMPEAPENPFTESREPRCGCPCADGLSISLQIDLKIGIFWKQIFDKAPTSSGTTKNPTAKPPGKTLDLDGETTLDLDFGNANLGPWEKDEVRVRVQARPFFAKGLPEGCCVMGRGAFDGTATITVTKLGKRSSGSTHVLVKPFAIGACKGKVCCATVYQWPFQDTFKVPIPGYSIEAKVDGQIFATAIVVKME